MEKETLKRKFIILKMALYLGEKRGASHFEKDKSGKTPERGGLSKANSMQHIFKPK